MADRLIRAATVVSLDPDVGTLDEADILVDDGEIVEIGPGLDASADDVIDADPETVREFEGDVASEANVDSDAVVLDVPSRPSMPESTTRVLVNGEVRRLGEQSTLVGALRAAQRDQWRFGVYAPAEVAERVGDAAVRELGLDVEDTRVRDVRPGIHATLDEFE